MSRRLWHVAMSGIVLLGAVGLIAGACEPFGTMNVEVATDSGPVAWGPCDQVATSTGFECATMRVPLDYEEPDGDTIGISLIRLPAKDQKRRIGSLVFNFGGPGGSGVDTLLNAAPAFAALGQRYDLVSFDPRGVERSSGVRCLDDKAMDEYLAAEPSEDVAEETRLVTGFAKACEQNSGKILPYIATVDAARDMEMLRDVLGDPWLNYFGFSYGTHLGAVYATLYPELVGRMVLDSALDPSVSLLETARTQVIGFQRAFENYLNACVEQRRGCPLGKNVESANRAVTDLLVDLRHKPLPVNGRSLTENLARSGIVEALYSEQTWPLLTDALKDGLHGDASGLLNLADQYGGREPDGSYSTLQSSLNAIVCADNAERPTVAQAVATAHELSKKSPVFSANAISSGICSVWPVPGNDESKHVDATGSKPIVVVGVTHDPATPYQWAPRLARQLRTGVLLTLAGEGHGAYGQSPCIDTAVNAYLLGGKVPPNRLRCT